MPELIYICEDDESISEIIAMCLKSENYDCVKFDSAKAMLPTLKYKHPDLMPGINGYEALREIKNNDFLKDISVIMISAKTEEMDKVKGLDLGADDYIAKPFGLLELRARVKAALRKKPKENEVIKIKDIVINNSKHEVTKENKVIELTQKEYDLLSLLMKNKDKVISREKILHTVWGFDFIGESRTLDMHVKNLREKIGDNGKDPKYIKTIRSVGYKFIA